MIMSELVERETEESGTMASASCLLTGGSEVVGRNDTFEMFAAIIVKLT